MADGSPLAHNPLAHSPTLSATAPHGEEGAKLEAGAKAGEYVIERFIGAGAMGEVHAGRHPVIGKRVAIKVLRHDLAASAEAAERFIREARAVNQIEHENVVDVFAFGRLDDGRLYLVMDLVEGKSLRTALVNGPLELDLALHVLDTIAGALDAAHARGVVHRDLKPDNIVLSNATPPKVFVLDFGIAKLISTVNAGEKTGPGTLTGQGTWLGTPGYMAPEQWSVDGAGPASDRYALGVIAFELLSGALPFSASSVPGMMEQHFRAEIPALSSRGAVGVPPAFNAVLRRALAKDPDARYPTARAFVTALRAAAGPGPHRARGAVSAPASARKLWLPATAGAAVLGVAIVVAITSNERDSQPRTAMSPATMDQPRAGAVGISVRSIPSGADVKVGNEERGKTPAHLQAKPGEKLDLVISKPGYLTATRSIIAEQRETPIVVDARLDLVTGFEGVWKLGNGELRAFQRNGDQVDVFKIKEVAGERTFFKHYDFVTSDRGIAFAAEDEIVDSRAPNDPRCHVRVRVEYRYDPVEDALEQRRDKVKIDLHDGSCVVRERSVEPSLLARVDNAHAERELSAPVGVPEKPRPVPVKKRPPKQKLEAQQVAPTAKNVKQPPREGKGKAAEFPPEQRATPSDQSSNQSPQTAVPQATEAESQRGRTKN